MSGDLLSGISQPAFTTVLTGGVLKSKSVSVSEPESDDDFNKSSLNLSQTRVFSEARIGSETRIGSESRIASEARIGFELRGGFEARVESESSRSESDESTTTMG